MHPSDSDQFHQMSLKKPEILPNLHHTHPNNLHGCLFIQSTEPAANSQQMETPEGEMPLTGNIDNCSNVRPKFGATRSKQATTNRKNPSCSKNIDQVTTAAAPISTDEDAANLNATILKYIRTICTLNCRSENLSTKSGT